MSRLPEIPAPGRSRRSDRLPHPADSPLDRRDVRLSFRGHLWGHRGGCHDIQAVAGGIGLDQDRAYAFRNNPDQCTRSGFAAPVPRRSDLWHNRRSECLDRRRRLQVDHERSSPVRIRRYPYGTLAMGTEGSIYGTTGGVFSTTPLVTTAYRTRAVAAHRNAVSDPVIRCELMIPLRLFTPANRSRTPASN
jgi:hypothetical protein